MKRYQRLASRCSVNGRCAMVLEARGFQLEGGANNPITHLRLFLSPNLHHCNLPGIHDDLKFIENLSGELIYIRKKGLALFRPLHKHSHKRLKRCTNSL